MPVNPYGTFLEGISGIDAIGQRYKNLQAANRSLQNNQNSVKGLNSLTDTYNSVRKGLEMGKSKTITSRVPDGFSLSIGGGGSAAPTGGGGGSQLERFLNSMATQESNHNYNARGIVTRSGDRAYGKYQIMGNNIGPWSQQYLGRRVSVNEYMRSPQIQEQLTRAVLSDYVNKYGYGGAAAAWYGGPRAGKAYASGVRNTKPQYGGPSIAAYVSKVLSRM